MAGITVENHGGYLKLTLLTHGHDAILGRFKLDASLALDVAGQLVSQTAYAVEDAMTQAVRGPCGKCFGHRLVVVQKHGRDVTVRCPACADRMGVTAEVALRERQRPSGGYTRG